MRKLLTCILTIVFLLSISLTASANTAQSGFSLEYHLYMEVEDHPRVEVRISGLQEKVIEFYFASSNGGIFGAMNDLTGIFTDVSVSRNGEELSWKWKNNKSILIENLDEKDFTIKYNIDALKIGRVDTNGDINNTLSGEKFVIFREKAVFFSPTETLMMPSIEPEKITLKTHFPEKMELFSSLQNNNGIFIAEKDLWNNLVYDFSKTYFYGGKTIFHDELKGVSGNTYQYVLFNWRGQSDFYDSWFLSYADKKAAAQKYMQIMDMFYKYYSDHIAPLPAHSVIITDNIPDGYYGLPRVADRGNHYNHMQLWPENSMLTQVAHHVFHAYLFDSGLTAKLNVGTDHFLSEGLPTYYEHIVPGILLGDDFYMGRMYGLLMLDQRGERSGIKNNQFHQRYNESTLKVYLLDEAIKKATGGGKDINDFTRELYALAEDLKTPQQLTEEQIEAAFSKTIGPEDINLYREIANMKEFNPKDFSNLSGAFRVYSDKMANEYFWGSRLLFLSYMDICSAMGEHWPHFGLIEHNTGRMRGEALKGFKEYLQGLGKSKFSREDIINAMSYVTGKDHSGFFEYWSSMGIELDLGTIPALNTWYPERDARYSTKYIPSMSMFAGDIPVDGKLLVMDGEPSNYEPSRAEDRSVGYLSPSTIQIGVPTEVKLVIVDPRLVSDDNSVRITVASASDGNLGNMIYGVQDHTTVANFEYQGVVSSFEYGYLHLEKTESGWQGTVTLVLPEDFYKVQLRATDESIYNYTLAVQLVDHYDEDEDKPAMDEFEEDKNGVKVIYYIIGGVLLLLVIGVYYWQRQKKR